MQTVLKDTLRLGLQGVNMIAHRGVSGLERENTCAAFVAAGNRSYYGIETDIHRTADGDTSLCTTMISAVWQGLIT